MNFMRLPDSLNLIIFVDIENELQSYNMEGRK